MRRTMAAVVVAFILGLLCNGSLVSAEAMDGWYQRLMYHDTVSIKDSVESMDSTLKDIKELLEARR